jgi:uncharacterized membrane-anchored protein
MSEDNQDRFIGMWTDFTAEEDRVFESIVAERAMTLREYAELYKIPLDAEAYRNEFPEDAPFTRPPKE